MLFIDESLLLMKSLIKGCNLTKTKLQFRQHPCNIAKGSEKTSFKMRLEVYFLFFER